MANLRSRNHNNCPRCLAISAEDTPVDEYYEILSLRFNIRVAEQLARGHVPIRVEAGALARWLAQVPIDQEHVGHLPQNLGPGIMVTLPSGCGMPLIHGNHRAARDLREGRNFLAFVLSEKETLKLLRESMGKKIADDCWVRIRDSKPHPADAPEDSEP